MKPLIITTKIGNAILDIEQSSYLPHGSADRVPNTYGYVTLFQEEMTDENVLTPAKSMKLYITDAKIAQAYAAHFGALARALMAKGVE